jgi:hypothetical protein
MKAGNVENLAFVTQKNFPVKPIISEEAQNASGKTRPKKCRIPREKSMVDFSRPEKPSKTSRVAGEKIQETLFLGLFSTYFPWQNRRDWNYSSSMFFERKIKFVKSNLSAATPRQVNV